MNRKDAEALARKLMDEHGLTADGWRFAWGRGKATFGTCNFTHRTIKLSSVLVELNDADRVRNTILHEIAHALAGFKAAHGPAWKRVCVQIGAEPNRTCGEGVAVPEHRWHGTCPTEGCDVVLKRHKLTARTRRGACPKCCRAAGGYSPRFRLVWGQNPAFGRPARQTNPSRDVRSAGLTPSGTSGSMTTTANRTNDTKDKTMTTANTTYAANKTEAREVRQGISEQISAGTLPAIRLDAFTAKPETTGSRGLCSVGRHETDTPATSIAVKGNRVLTFCAEHAIEYAEANGLDPEGIDAADVRAIGEAVAASATDTPEAPAPATVSPWLSNPNTKGKAHFVDGDKTLCGKDAGNFTDPAGDDALCGTCAKKAAA